VHVTVSISKSKLGFEIKFNMTDSGFVVEDTTDLTTMTPVYITQQTATGSRMTSTGSSMTSSMSPRVQVYFQCAVIVIGVVGTAANALILYAMVASEQHKKQVLIFNQNILDFVTCFSLVVTYSFRVYNPYITGTPGYWLCILIMSELLVWIPNAGSLINLAAISIERYIKVVHPIWSKKRLLTWVIYSAALFSWIAGVVVNAAVTVPTTDVVKGSCYAHMFWESQAAHTAYVVWYVLSFYVVIILIFTFCYWRILAYFWRIWGRFCLILLEYSGFILTLTYWRILGDFRHILGCFATSAAAYSALIAILGYWRILDDSWRILGSFHLLRRSYSHYI